MHAVALLALLLTSPAQGQGDFETALRAYHSSRFRVARKLWLPLAEAGDARAQYYLGEMHSAGMGVPRDYARAVNWYTRASDQRHTKAQTRLGYLLLKGLGVPRDPEQAFKHYLSAANAGDLQGQYKLGFLFAEGLGVAADPVQAYKWWSAAASMGDPDAADERDRIAKRLTPEQITRARKSSSPR